jgi:hypothetical protein
MTTQNTIINIIDIEDTYTCVNCGREFDMLDCTSGGTSFCSHECETEHMYGECPHNEIEQIDREHSQCCLCGMEFNLY